MAKVRSRALSDPRRTHSPPECAGVDGENLTHSMLARTEAHSLPRDLSGSSSSFFTVGQPNQNQACGIEQLSDVAENLSLLVCGANPSRYKENSYREKGGESMKIKVNVRAGGFVKAR